MAVLSALLVAVRLLLAELLLAPFLSLACSLVVEFELLDSFFLSSRDFLSSVGLSSARSDSLRACRVASDFESGLIVDRRFDEVRLTFGRSFGNAVSVASIISVAYFLSSISFCALMVVVEKDAAFAPGTRWAGKAEDWNDGGPKMLHKHDEHMYDCPIFELPRDSDGNMGMAAFT